jgi:ubiquinone/menaquinone biosynthesis C-methylase UbiE
MTPNEQQSEAWNGAESVHYIDYADRYDRQVAPFTDALLDRAQLGARDHVLDVGCGSGTTTLAAASAASTALGIDISEPLLQVASERARSASIDNAEFVVADAQTHAFESEFDVVLSQFGLMFFDDPVAAFANLRRALAPGGRMVFVCWQALQANEWLMILHRALARRVALPALGGLAAGPGMFALKDPDETAALLDAAGFTTPDLEPIAPTLLLGGGGTLDDSLEFLLGTGIARGLLGRLEGESRAEVIEEVRDGLASHYEEGAGISLGASGWLVSAGR